MKIFLVLFGLAIAASVAANENPPGTPKAGPYVCRVAWQGAPELSPRVRSYLESPHIPAGLPAKPSEGARPYAVRTCTDGVTSDFFLLYGPVQEMPGVCAYRMRELNKFLLGGDPYNVLRSIILPPRDEVLRLLGGSCPRQTDPGYFPTRNIPPGVLLSLHGFLRDSFKSPESVRSVFGGVLSDPRPPGSKFDAALKMPGVRPSAFRITRASTWENTLTRTVYRVEVRWLPESRLKGGAIILADLLDGKVVPLAFLPQHE